MKTEKTKLTNERKEANKIDVVIIEFADWPNLWYHKAEWDEQGGYKGFLKTFAVSIRDIIRVNYKRVHFKDFPTTEWQG